MSHIKRLKLQGFKSFANPTVLTFEKGFNTIVGANGSGKSNVFDAMCFVLGRMSSKELRAEKLGNLVFNGGKSQKAAKEAEVSIFLSNEQRELMSEDLDEIKISRVVNKDGQSRYLLNNNKVTRTEILEILGRAQIDPDGYNIILQGDIVKIVNMSAVERRELIEEISNISGYEEKRQKSMTKLDSIEKELKDADLLLEEKTKYLRELKSEKEQAEKYHQVKEDLRYKNLLLVKAKMARNASLKQKKEEELATNEEHLQSYRSVLDEFDAKSKDIDKQINELEKSIEVQSHQDFISVTNKITSLEGEVNKYKEKKAENQKHRDELKNRNSGIAENLKSNKEQLQQLKQEVQQLEKEKKDLNKQLQDIEQQISSRKEGMSSEHFQEIDQLDEQIQDLEAKKSEKELHRQDTAIQMEKLNTKIEHLKEQQQSIEQTQQENQEQFKQLEAQRKELKDLILQISEKSQKNSEVSARINSIQKEYSELVEQHSKLRMKVDASRDYIATNKAVDAINKLKEKDKRIHGTVADLASGSDKYSTALETAAGRGLFNIVVDDDKTAVTYINYLKENKIGSATFLPLNKITTEFSLPDSVLNKKGVVDYAIKLVSFDTRYKHIFHYVFGDTLVIEQVEDAKNVGFGKHRMVSMTGDIVSKSGAMSGGFQGKKKGMGIFKDEKLEKQLEEVEQKTVSLKGTLDQLKSEKEESEQELYDLRHKKIEVEGEVSKLEKMLSVDGQENENLQEQISGLESDKSVLENSLKKVEKEIEDIKTEIQNHQQRRQELKAQTSGQNAKLEELNQLEGKRDELREQVQEYTTSIGNKNIQISNVIEPEIKNLEKIKKDNDEALERLKQERDELTSTIQQMEEELKENRKKERELSKDYKDHIAKRDKLKEERKKLEEKYEKEFAKFDKIKEKSSQLRYAISEYENLNKTLQDELEVLYDQIKSEFVEQDEENAQQELETLINKVEEALQQQSLDVKELQNKVNNLKTRINSFGSINMRAVEVYDKLNEEFHQLVEKRETLTNEKNDILSFIAEIDEKKREAFMDTFGKLRENFERIFNKLSAKGKVELVIENEKDLFNSGVEIKVRLSEKNYLDIKSLSGGEKTITAIAFIFAVQEFSPASFYILDEVDAALDIVNAEKLGKLIKEYAGKAQYIVVSHNEHFIQSSEVIYGVTMDADKISSVVSLDLRDMKEYVDDEGAAATS